MNRAGQFTEAFDAVLACAGVEVVEIPPRSPSANTHAERWGRTVRGQVTDRMLIVGERHLRAALDRYAAHYNLNRCCATGMPASRPAAAPCSPVPPHWTPTSAADRTPPGDRPSDYAIASSTTAPIRPPSNSR